MNLIESIIRRLKNDKKSQKGFTLIEILVVIGIIAILAAIVIIAINPSRQFAQAHNTQRISGVTAILNAVGQNIIDNRGTFTCAIDIAGSSTPITIPATSTIIKKEDGVDLRPCIVPTYISEIPVDPTSGSNSCDEDLECSTGDYNTGYEIFKNATTSRITVTAPDAELNQTISITR